MTDTPRIEDQIKSMIVERLFLPIQPEDIGDEDSLTEKLDIDSVQLFEIVVGTEDTFGITLEDTEFNAELFRDVKSIAAVVRQKLQESSQ